MSQDAEPQANRPPLDRQEEVVDLQQILVRDEAGERRHQWREKFRKLLEGGEEAASGSDTKSAASAAYLNAQAVVSQQIKGLDERLSRKVNQVLHAPKFQSMEAAWTGLASVVQKAEEVRKKSGKPVAVYAMHATLKDLAGDVGFKPAAEPDALTGTHLYKQVFDAHYNDPTSSPLGLLVFDYEFSHAGSASEGGPALLDRIAEVAQAAHTVLVATPAPAVLGLPDWSAINTAEIGGTLKSVAHNEFNRLLRKSGDRRGEVVGLALPRVLGRAPYGLDAVADFRYEEQVAGHADYLWVNPAFAVARLVVNAFSRSDLYTAITGETEGGRLDGTAFDAAGERQGKPVGVGPLEVGILYDREATLKAEGLMPLLEKDLGDHRGALLRFTPSLQLIATPKLAPNATPEEREEAARDRLHCDFRYQLLLSRIVHEIHAVLQKLPGQTVDEEDVERAINQQISPYIGQPKDQFPLDNADIKVRAVPGRPGYFNIDVTLYPHFVFQGAHVRTTLAGMKAGTDAP